MSDRIDKTSLFDKTIAEVTFDNGHTMSFSSDFESAMNGGATYSGADWTTFGHFQREVETKVADAQAMWGLPDAQIRYVHIRRTTQKITRNTDVRKLHATRYVRRETEGESRG